jgi:hypothetical protein
MSHPDYRLRAPGVGQKGDDLHRSLSKLKSRTLAGTMNNTKVHALFLILNTTTTHYEENIVLTHGLLMFLAIYKKCPLDILLPHDR